MMSAVMPWLGDFASDLTCAEVPAVIGETPVMACCLQAAGVMDEECKLKAFISRHKLKKLRSWGKRGTQLDAQLGNHHEPAAMGEPTLCSEARGINGKKPRALRAHWSSQCCEGRWCPQAPLMRGWAQARCPMALSACCSDVRALHQATMHVSALCHGCCSGCRRCLCRCQERLPAAASSRRAALLGDRRGLSILAQEVTRQGHRSLQVCDPCERGSPRASGKAGWSTTGESGHWCPGGQGA